MIVKMSHVGIIVNSIEKAAELWKETYGLEILKYGKIDSEGVKNCFLMIGNINIELIEPINKNDMNNPIAKRLMMEGEGVFHFALVVDDLEKTYEEYTKKGLSLVRRDPIEDEPKGRIVIHPKNANGVLLELVEKGV